MPMPNFLVIGANKAGTSSLYAYLRQHPDVYMSPVKEPLYFSRSGKTPVGNRPDLVLQAGATRTLDEYLALFAAVTGEKAIGEASTSYLSNPRAPARIHEALPQAKLIAILRHPAERAFSAYAMYFGLGFETMTFEEVVALGPVGRGDGTWRRPYLRVGFYGAQLTRYFELFEREQIMIRLYEDLSADPASLLQDVFAFLDIDPAFVPDMSSRHNQRPYRTRSTAVARAVGRPSRMKSALSRALPERARDRLRRQVVERNRVVPEFPTKVREHLIELYRDDVHLLQDLIGRDLSAWLT